MKLIPRVTTKWLAFVTIIALTVAACKKDNSATDTPQQQEDFAMAASASDAQSESVFDDVFNNVMGVNQEVALGGTGVFGSANYNATNGEILSQPAGADSTIPCFTVTITPLNPPDRFPLQVVIDFGGGCTGADGRTRQGKIIIVYTARLIEPGASATTTFDNYYIDSIHVEGTHKIINESTQDKKVFHVQVIDAKLTRTSGNFSEWNSDKKIEQTEGLGTPLWPLDDVFNVTGEANGNLQVNGKFYQWATIITSPLVKRFTCRWIEQGSITIKKSNRPVAVLDYGAGDCDNKATITVNGVVHEITLH